MSKVSKIFHVLVCYVRPADMDRYLGDLLDEITTEEDLRAWIDSLDNDHTLRLGSVHEDKGAIGHHNNPFAPKEEQLDWITGIGERKERKMALMPREDRWNYILTKFKKYLGNVTLDEFLIGTTHRRPIKVTLRRTWQLWKEERNILPPPPPGTPPLSHH